MIKYLVTGGSGFIGTNLVEALLNSGFDVINVDIKEPLNKNHAQYFRKIDIREQAELDKCIKEYEPDYIIHLAARCDLNGDKLSDYNTNSVGVENVLKSAKGCSNLKKIIITSSMLVCEPGYQPKDEHDYKASTLYGESKILTEEITWKSGLEIDWAIVRPTSIWGPWFNEPYKQFFEMIRDGHYIHIGKNTACMTYGYVENAVRQILDILKADTTNGPKVFYLGDYIPTPIESWADEIGECYGKHIITAPRWLIDLAAKFGDVLKRFGIRFPLTSFRLNNMIKDNIIDLNATKRITVELPMARVEGIKKTVEWMESKR